RRDARAAAGRRRRLRPGRRGGEGLRVRPAQPARARTSSGRSVTLVAGVDSSTQSCKVVVRDAESGALVRRGAAPHPPGTEVDPAAWEAALQRAVTEAGGLTDVAAVAVAGQQHGMVCLDAEGRVVRDA